MLTKKLVPQPAGPTPMIMQLTRETLLDAINQALRAEQQSPLPQDTQISVHIPGDYSNTDLTLDHNTTLDLRWMSDQRQPTACSHDWQYQGIDRGGSHKGEDCYACSKCLAIEYRP